MRRPAVVLPPLLAALGLVAAGCGGGRTVGALPDTVVGSVPAATQPSAAQLPALKLKGDVASGKKVFAAAGCTACHTLKAAGATGTVGPNLDQKKPPFALVVERVTLGRNAMPPFKGRLTEQQIADVAQYVSTAAAGG